MANVASTYDTIVIGGGQAGLSTGYYLKQAGQNFVILDAGERIGDSWRRRWDSLRLFTPACFDGLVGMRFPGPGWAFPTKDQMADYLEAYATRFQLPVRTGVRVERLTHNGERFVVAAGDLRFEADSVVVAMSSFQRGRTPAFARELDPGIVQLHSSDYHSPAQLRDGGVLLVGAGNSGAEIAVEVAREHPTWVSGRDTGHVPFRIEGLAARVAVPVLFRVIFHRLLTLSTPLGRRMRGKGRGHGWPLVRVKPKDLAAAGVQRVPRTTGVQGGRPLLADGRVLDVANVIWCTGYEPGFSWIDLPVPVGEEPAHERGVVAAVPGLYFVGLEFLYAASSVMIHGMGRDAEYVARAVLARRRALQRAGAPQSARLSAQTE